jgi:hypothetical protein
MSYSRGPLALPSLGAGFLVALVLGELFDGYTAAFVSEVQPWYVALLFWLNAVLSTSIAVFTYIYASKSNLEDYFIPRNANYFIFVTVIPWIARHYVSSMDNAEMRGRPRALPVLAYGAALFAFALICFVVAASIGVRLGLGVSVVSGFVIAFLAVGGALSKSFPVVFTLAFFCATGVLVFFFPDLDFIVATVVVVFARAWLSALVLTAFVMVVEFCGEKFSRWVGFAASCAGFALAAFLLALIMWQALTISDGEPVPFGEWVVHISGLGAMVAILWTLWLFAPLIAMEVCDRYSFKEAS